MLCRFNIYYMCVGIVCILTQNNVLFERKSSNRKSFFFSIGQLSVKKETFEKRFMFVLLGFYVVL